MQPLLVFVFVCFALADVNFVRKEIDSHLYGDYGVKLHDVTGDGKQDIISIAYGGGGVYYYPQPSWDKRLLANVRRLFTEDYLLRQGY
jgi:hypothetical protein